ncbi:hypothetical protein RI367_006407 [Sorochytrium milnesiophthora]
MAKRKHISGGGGGDDSDGDDKQQLPVELEPASSSSESEDVDYVPEDDDVSSADDLEGDEEDDDTLEHSAGDSRTNAPTDSKTAEQEHARKVRIDALWRDFQSDKALGSSPTGTASTATTATAASIKPPPASIEATAVPVQVQRLAPRYRPRPVARSRGLTLLAQRYGVPLGPPTKLNTLAKSRQDWDKYVQREGLADDLAQHNKDGYLEKQAFLHRTDARQEQAIKQLRKQTRR